MRDIKFRVFTPALGGSMFYGGFSIHATGKFISSENERPLIGISAEDTPLVMQFTGLTDKEGNNIYEGDILECWGDLSYECNSSMHVVEFKSEHGYAAFDLTPTVEVECNALSYFIESGAVEIIGNVHQHADLLDGNCEPKSV